MKEYLELFKEEFDATVEDKCSPSNKPYVAYSPVSGVAYTKHVTAQAIDLGLSVKWASCNIGATFPEDFGDYFAWGEIETKEWFDAYDGSYKWGDLDAGDPPTKYNLTDGITTLLPEDDAAHVLWGGQWRIPSPAEIQELVDNCTFEYYILNGIKGCKVTSNINNNYIFLPHTGYKLLSDVDFWYTSYWTNTCVGWFLASEPDMGRALSMELGEGSISDISANYVSFRADGCPIRPVCS